MNDDRLNLRGSPGSPYTRKMLAVLRYRRIQYNYHQAASPALPEPKVRLIPVVYFPDATGALQPEVDSTPIIRRLERDYPTRQIIPENPVVSLLNALLEDYGDEWLTKAMFHYRWHYAEDIELAGSVLPHYADVTQADETLRTLKQVFSDRQINRLYVVGSNATTTPVIEASYKRCLDALNAHLQHQPFLLGDRPASSDFAWFGQLTQLAQFDPTPSRLTRQNYPRVDAWVSKCEDLSGLSPHTDGFFKANQVSDTLKQIFTEMGRTYVPVMLANAAAVDLGQAEVRTEVDGEPWVQTPFPYQAKCLHWLRQDYARLDQTERETLGEMINGTGCERLFMKPTPQ